MNTTYVVALSITLMVCFFLWTKGKGRSITYSPKSSNTKDALSRYEKDNDTILFRVTDDKGTVSSIHDSGIKLGEFSQKQSSQKRNKFEEFSQEQSSHEPFKPVDLPIQFYILKKEIIGGKVIELSTPLIIEYGRRAHSLERKEYIQGFQDKVSDEVLNKMPNESEDKNILGPELQTFDDHFLVKIYKL